VLATAWPWRSSRGGAGGRGAARLGAAVELRDVGGRPRPPARRRARPGRRRCATAWAGSPPTRPCSSWRTSRRATAGRVASLVKSAALRDRDGLVHGKAQLLTRPRNEWREASLFVPFFAMDLGAGSTPARAPLLRARQHRRLHGRAAAAPGQARRRVPRGGGVREAALRAGAAPRPPRRGRPGGDRRRRPGVAPGPPRPPVAAERPHHRRARRRREVVLFRSKVRRDTFAGDWTEPSPPVPVSQGDRLTWPCSTTTWRATTVSARSRSRSRRSCGPSRRPCRRGRPRRLPRARRRRPLTKPGPVLTISPEIYVRRKETT